MAAAPVFVQYRPEDTQRLRLATPYGGRLTQRGPCLGLVTAGLFSTIIWPSSARLSFDSRGLLLTDSSTGARLRLGDYLVGTGGPLPPGARQPLGGTTLSTDFHIDCARRPSADRKSWIGIVNAGFRKR